jgi:hypothetical protein
VKETYVWPFLLTGSHPLKGLASASTYCNNPPLPVNRPKLRNQFLTKGGGSLICPTVPSWHAKGKGRWLYGSMLNWNELDQPGHRAMLEDVKTMIAVRKQGADVLAAAPDCEQPRLRAVSCQGDVAVPVPYVRWNRQHGIVVVANRDTDRDAHLRLQIPLAEIGLAGHARYRVVNLWPGGPSTVCSAADLAALTIVVPRDRTAGGRLRVLRIEPNE